MPADKGLRGLVHAGRVKRLVNPPCPVSMQRGALESIEDAIAIAARGRRKACVEVVCDGLRPRDADIVWKIAIGAEQPAPIAALTARIEMNNLASRVDPGISSAGTYDLDGLVSYRSQRLLHLLLHANAGFLALPAIVSGAVVFDAERDTDARASLAR